MSPRLLGRAGIALLAAATVLPAQFWQLAGTDDGKTVYFISPLTLYNAPASASPETRLYRIGPDGLVLAAERPASSPSGLEWFTSSSDGVSGPQVSGDGSLIGFTYHNVCNPLAASPGCSPISTEAELRGSQNTHLGPGTLQLSRNGRWALIFPDPISDPYVLTQPPAVLLDLTTGARSDVPVSPFPMRILASDGSVLVPGGIWKQGKITPIPFPAVPKFNPQALSDNGAVVISFAFVPNVPNSIEITATDAVSGKTTSLYHSTESTIPFFMALSNDGRRALYRVTALASNAGTPYFVDTANGESTAIVLPDGELVIDGTLGGDGSIAFLVTTLGRILKVTLATGAVEPLIPPTPYIPNLPAVAIGSLLRLPISFPGTAADWAGRILLGNQPLPVISAKPGEVDVQIPWEQPAGTASLQIAIPTGSPFQQSQTLQVLPVAPAFEPLDAGQSAVLPIKIVKGDWSGLQTTLPGPGDILYIYMTGLGPVSGAVQTAVPASTTTVNPIQGTLTCTFSPQSTPAETLFAGLAPGLIGVYQVAFRMPTDAGTLPLNGMQCSLSGAGGSAGFGFSVSNVGTIAP